MTALPTWVIVTGIASALTHVIGFVLLKLAVEQQGEAFEQAEKLRRALREESDRAEELEARIEELEGPPVPAAEDVLGQNEPRQEPEPPKPRRRRAPRKKKDRATLYERLLDDSRFEDET